MIFLNKKVPSLHRRNKKYKTKMNNNNKSYWFASRYSKNNCANATKKNKYRTETAS